MHNLATDNSGQNGYAAGNDTDFSGTSSATPILAGAASLLLSANDDLTESELRENLKQAADKVGTTPYQNGRKLIMQRLTPFLWYDGKAEEAMNFYVSIFKDSKILSIKYWGEGSPFPKEQVMSATFELDGQQFHAMDAGPKFKFTEAISIFVNCETQDEVDHYWEKLSEGGQEQPCGWLKDRYGQSWQIVPSVLGKLMDDPDPVKSKRVIDSMLKMKRST